MAKFSRKRNNAKRNSKRRNRSRRGGMPGFGPKANADLVGNDMSKVKEAWGKKTPEQLKKELYAHENKKCEYVSDVMQRQQKDPFKICSYESKYVNYPNNGEMGLHALYSAQEWANEENKWDNIEHIKHLYNDYREAKGYKGGKRKQRNTRRNRRGGKRTNKNRNNRNNRNKKTRRQRRR